MVKRYYYRCRDKAGRVVSGEIMGTSQEEVSLNLTSLGYFPIYVTEKKKSFFRDYFLKFFRKKKVSLWEIGIYSRQLALLHKAGLTIISSLEALKEEQSNLKFKEVLAEIIEDIKRGKSLSEAMERYPSIFSPIYINMLKSAEISGRLTEILERLATFIDYEVNFRHRIKRALRYPFFVIVSLCIAFIIITSFVIPRFMNLYSQFSHSLPLPTQIMFFLSKIISRYWWVISIIFVASMVMVNIFIRSNKGRLFWDDLKLKIPLLGKLILKIIICRFCRISALLLKSGVNISQTIEMGSRIVGNLIVSSTLSNIKERLREGKSLSELMRASGMFSPIVIQMVDLGEKTGELENFLDYVANYYEIQIDYTLDNFVSLLEPILILGLGAIVLFMALGVFLPIWNIYSLFR